MGFRANMQHLRATRNMTQEQLAMLLGVSRQSVSKWEAERAYPEMDKLLRMCDLFECTLDELVSGDLTGRPGKAVAAVPRVEALQDVTGYDQAMRAFAWKAPLGLSASMMGIALAVLFSGFMPVQGAINQSYASVLAFLGIAVGCAFALPAIFDRREFRKAHPFVEDFYTADQKSQSRAAMAIGLVAGIGLILTGLAGAVVLWADVWTATATGLAFFAVGVFVMVRGRLLSLRCDLPKYNWTSLRSMTELQIEALDDGDLASRARRARRERNLLVVVMSVATVAGLVMMFIPALNRLFLLSWPIGGLVYVAIKALCSMRN